MTKKEQNTLDNVDGLLSAAKEDLYDGYDEMCSAETEDPASTVDDAKLPKKAIRKALKKISTANDKLRALLA